MRSIIVYENLRVELARRNYTIQNVADVLGIDRTTAGSKLSGKREFSLKEAFRLSEDLLDGAPLEYLFSEKKKN